jgi:hypothetical protein
MLVGNENEAVGIGLIVIDADAFAVHTPVLISNPIG